jgi:hypothetical protein
LAGAAPQRTANPATTLSMTLYLGGRQAADGQRAGDRLL